MGGYRLGLAGAPLEYATTHFNGHRCLPARTTLASFDGAYDAFIVYSKENEDFQLMFKAYLKSTALLSMLYYML